MGRPAHTPGGGGVRTGEAQEQPCRCSPPQPPPHLAAGPTAPACAQEVESPPDGGTTGPVFRCAYALVLCLCSGLVPKPPTAEPMKDCSP
eukprot:SM000167S02963  [mRNA]  locus=s167:121988:122301:- [translate_table: standard]